jgi:succinate dehydrogenase/fumarate reductase flavoprotein subunit
MIGDSLPLVPVDGPAPDTLTLDKGDEALVAVCVRELGRAMWADGGLLRSASGLESGLRALAKSEADIAYFEQLGKSSRRPFEAQSLACVARAILCSALAREESRGAHFRSDFSHRDDERFQKHSIYTADGTVTFESW